MFQQKEGGYGFITWNLILCNNNVIVIMEVLFIWLLPPIMWYIFTYLYLFDCKIFQHGNNWKKNTQKRISMTGVTLL